MAEITVSGILSCKEWWERTEIGDDGARDVTEEGLKGLGGCSLAQDLAGWFWHHTGARGIKLLCVEAWEAQRWGWVNPFPHCFHPAPPCGKSRRREEEDLCVWVPLPKAMKCHQLT